MRNQHLIGWLEGATYETRFRPGGRIKTVFIDFDDNQVIIGYTNRRRVVLELTRSSISAEHMDLWVSDGSVEYKMERFADALIFDLVDRVQRTANQVSITEMKVNSQFGRIYFRLSNGSTVGYDQLCKANAKLIGQELGAYPDYTSVCSWAIGKFINPINYRISL